MPDNKIEVEELKQGQSTGIISSHQKEVDDEIVRSQDLAIIQSFTGRMNQIGKINKQQQQLPGSPKNAINKDSQFLISP